MTTDVFLAVSAVALRPHGFFLQPVQPFAGFALAAAPAALAVQLPQVAGRASSTGGQRSPVPSSNSPVER